MKKWRAGSWVVMIGALHTWVMFTLGGEYLWGMIGDGWVGEVEPDPMRMAVFWSFFFGLVLMGYGWTLRALEAALGEAPLIHSTLLCGVAIVGGLAIPASGFWLALAPAALIFRRSGRAIRSPAPLVL